MSNLPELSKLHDSLIRANANPYKWPGILCMSFPSVTWDELRAAFAEERDTGGHSGEAVDMLRMWRHRLNGFEPLFIDEPPSGWVRFLIRDKAREGDQLVSREKG